MKSMSKSHYARYRRMVWGNFAGYMLVVILRVVVAWEATPHQQHYGDIVTTVSPVIVFILATIWLSILTIGMVYLYVIESGYSDVKLWDE